MPYNYRARDVGRADLIALVPPVKHKPLPSKIPPQNFERKARGRPKLLSDAALRARIIEHGHALFVERGYGRATMDELAKRMHLSKQTLYRFFAGKAALFAAVAENHRHSMLNFSNHDGDLPTDRALAAIFRIDIDPKADRSRMALIEVVMREAGTYPELRQSLERHGIDSSRIQLGRWLARRAKRDELMIERPLECAGILMSMIFGSPPGGPPRKDDAAAFVTRRRAHIRRCIAIFLHGVGGSRGRHCGAGK